MKDFDNLHNRASGIARRRPLAQITLAMLAMALIAPCADAGVIAYWRFEEGVVNGRASGVGSIIDSVGTNNGFVDFEDLTVLLANWNKEVGADAGNLVNPTTTPVNFEDLTVLLADWTGPGPAGSPEAALGEAVPEPSSLLLLAIATLGLSFYRRRRRRAF